MGGSEPRRPAARWLVNAVVVGAATALYAQAAMFAFVVAALSMWAGAVLVVVAIPVLYVILVGFLTRATLGRSHWWASAALTAVLCGFAATVAGTGMLGGVSALPLSAGVVAAAASFLAVPGAMRTVGISAMIALLAFIAVPLVQVQTEIGAEEAARDQAELDRMASWPRPYVVPGYTIRVAGAIEGCAFATLSRDPDAPTRDGYHVDPSDISITTWPLRLDDGIEAAVCGQLLNPDLGASPGNACYPLDPDTWLLTDRGETTVARVKDGFLVRIGGGGAGSSELADMADRCVLMSEADFADWIRWNFERDERV